MRNLDKTLFIVAALSSGVAASAFIGANAFPKEFPIPMTVGALTTVTNYHHRLYGWPAIYATVTSHGSPRIIEEARFSLWALLVNLGVVSSFLALIWTTYYIMRVKRFSIAALFLIMTCIAVMVASIAQIRESSLPRRPRFKRWPHSALSTWSSYTGPSMSEGCHGSYSVFGGRVQSISASAGTQAARRLASRTRDRTIQRL
jgi:hypothetical protein